MQITLLILSVAACLANGLTASDRASIVLRVSGLDAKAAPASLAFGVRGDLFVIYREKDFSSESHTLSVCVFDSSTGQLQRSVKVQAKVRQLPIGVGMLQVSPDGRLLLYAEPPEVLTRGGGGYIIILDASTLKVIDSLDSATSSILGLPNLRVFGFGADSKSVLVGSSIRDEKNLLTTSVRVIALMAQDLRHTMKDVIQEDPYGTLFYTVDPAGVLLFMKNTPAGKLLVGPDGTRQTARPEVIVRSEYGFGHLLFLRDATLAITNSASNGRLTGEIYRFEKGQAEPVKAQSETDCWFRNSKISPDELIGVASCEATQGAELNFGSVTVRKAVIFDLRSLRILAAVPISKRSGSFDLAVWHGAEEFRLAMPNNSERIIVQIVKLKSAPRVQ